MSLFITEPAIDCKGRFENCSSCALEDILQHDDLHSHGEPTASDRARFPKRGLLRLDLRLKVLLQEDFQPVPLLVREYS